MSPKIIRSVLMILTIYYMNSALTSVMAETKDVLTKTIEAPWSYEGPRSPNKEKKERLGLVALKRKALAELSVHNALNVGGRVELVSIQFQRNIEYGPPVTGYRWGGPRNQKYWATAIGTMVYRMK